MNTKEKIIYEALGLFSRKGFDFKYEMFNKYKHEFPWIVKFEFNESRKKNIEIII
ncbi:hypothetical protein [Streptococcus iniae]|uniref:hypothetical protein n=1 Tax=Streptococcus iniae TaxID=1346 RepID=UPI00217E5B2F|nr:hypothetical protein [Streptococcus iniae]